MPDLPRAQKMLPFRSTPNAYEAEDQLVIGLDFGTTYSGIAYAFTQQGKPEAHSIRDWPGLEGHDPPKVPTTISYNPRNKAEFVWGGMKSKWPVIEAVKLLLDPDQEVPYYLPGAKNDTNELKKLGKTAVDVAADFIGAIYRHSLNKIESKMPKEYFAQCQKKFVISVPAVWSDKARSATERAAKKAGIHPVTMIKEPEAAALYTLQTQERALSAQDAFVICDAGGGTVDLISYEVTDTSPKLQLAELVQSKGGRAGSLGLNRRFESRIEELVGKKQFLGLLDSAGFDNAMKEFDRSIKTGFRGDEEEEYLVNFPRANLADDKEKNLSGNCWQMTGKDVKDIFDPLVSHICEMVREQVDTVRVKRLSTNHPKGAAIKAIFLVGGFGSSQYLKSRLSALHEDIQVVQPADAWSAIVKGAVLSQLPSQATVTTTVATKHYGVSGMTVYDDSRDKGQDKKWSPADGVFKAETMTWYINQGDDLVRGHKELHSYYRILDEHYKPEDLVFESELLESTAANAPVHPKDGLTKVNVTLKVDLRSIDTSLIKKRKGANGKMYCDLHFDLAMTVGPALFSFALEIGGVTMGSVDASYD